VLAALQVPVRVDSGLLPESVVDLDERGLLLDATATYLVGTRRLYEWADGSRCWVPSRRCTIRRGWPRRCPRRWSP